MNTDLTEELSLPGEILDFDPVCGMEVKNGGPHAHVYERQRFNFCSETCRDKFAREPLRYLVSCIELE